MSEREEMDGQSPPVDKMAIVMTKLLSKESTVRKRKRKRKGSETSTTSQISKDSITNEGSIEASNEAPISMDPVSLCHFPPEPYLWEYERKLKRLATRGVVHLFNVVNKQQKELQSKLDEVGPSETKRSKVMASVDKKQFLSMLKDKKQIKTPTNSSKDDLF